MIWIWNWFSLLGLKAYSWLAFCLLVTSMMKQFRGGRAVSESIGTIPGRRKCNFMVVFPSRISLSISTTNRVAQAQLQSNEKYFAIFTQAPRQRRSSGRELAPKNVIHWFKYNERLYKYVTLKPLQMSLSDPECSSLWILKCTRIRWFQKKGQGRDE